MATSFQVTFDASDPPRLAEFWCAVLGYIVQPPPDGWESWDDWATEMGIPDEQWDDVRAIVDPDGDGPRIFIQKVPEPKTAKNRVHLDVAVGRGADSDEARRALVEAEADRVTGLGASRLQIFDNEREFWIVMADPEGNEFCLH